MKKMALVLCLVFSSVLTLLTLGVAQDVNITGSSTVYPIAVALADEFNIETGIEVSVVSSGSSTGLKSLCSGNVPIANASRGIKEKDLLVCDKNGIARDDIIEIAIGLDALTVAVNPENDVVSCLDYDQLASIWQNESGIKNWTDVVDGAPEKSEIKLYGPSTASGTYGFFVEEVLHGVYGDEASHTIDYFPTEDDAVIVALVSENKYSLLYVGLAYYLENESTLKAVEIDGGDGCVAPSSEAATDGSYALSRPLFMYVNRNKLADKGVYEFLEFVLGEEFRGIITEIGYATLSDEMYEIALESIQ